MHSVQNAINRKDVAVKYYEPDEDEKRDAWEAKRSRNRNHGCKCGYPDMPGQCPGPANCPMVEKDEPELLYPNASALSLSQDD